jgi:ABC-type nitrate/sulfonate/bicarbonate transport system permease component
MKEPSAVTPSRGSGDEVSGVGSRMSLAELFTAYPNLVRAISLTVFLCVWEFVGRRMDPIFMTYPLAIFKATIGLVASGELLRGLMQSFVPFAIGMVISIVGGVTIGLAMGISRIFEYAVDPYVNALNAIPRVALVPLVILWCGLGVFAKIVIIVSVAIFPIIINTYSGVRDVRGVLLDVGNAYSATRWQTLRWIILPSALPFVMAGIRLGLGLGIIGMIVAEFFTAINGLGGIIVEYGNTFQTAKMFVAIFVVGIMGVVMSEAAMALERRWASWRVSERNRE